MSTVNHVTSPASHHEAAHNCKTPPPRSFEGELVSMTGNHLVITNTEGNKLSLSLAKGAKLTCDGAACGSEKLNIGRRIRVTTQIDNQYVAIGIESLDAKTELNE